jgi:dGTPase
MARENRERRRFREDEDADDTRDPFQHDRDRILYTSAFRRLAGVTQVVGAGEGHVFHNRLTHSLRVAQVARRLTERLIVQQPELADEAQIDPDVAESAALAHDLGHPPFGHVGESELDRLVREQGNVEDGFEGNAQSFRIVTRLSLRRERQRGLNLTRATLDALLKYPRFRDTAHPDATNESWRKFGAYAADRAMFDWVRLHDDTENACVEARIMDLADDVTYAVHDLEDFYRAGLVPLDRLLTVERERNAFVTASIARWREEGGRPQFNNDFLAERLDAILSLVGTQIPLREPFVGSERQRRALRRAASMLISKWVNASTLYERGDGGTTLQRTRVSRAEVEMLKQLTWHYVIRRPSLASQQLGQASVIKNLYRTYLSAMTDGPNRNSRLDVLPASARGRLRREEKAPRPHDAARARVAADIVCSMSEQQALDMHARVSGVSLGSITDLL